jgi:hypothetical protein
VCSSSKDGRGERATSLERAEKTALEFGRMNGISLCTGGREKPSEQKDHHVKMSDYEAQRNSNDCKYFWK